MLNKSPDWLAWILQFIVGFVVGGVVTAVLFFKWNRFASASFHLCFIFIGGGALIGAALASYYGDALWLEDFYRVIPPDEMKHSRASRLSSVIVGLIGVLLILWFLGHQMGYC